MSEDRLSIDEFARKMSDFFSEQWKAGMPKDYKGPNMTFVVAGFNEDEPYGKVYMFEIPQKPGLIEHHGGSDQFGITWGGQ